jgi:hypothetical protein
MYILRLIAYIALLSCVLWHKGYRSHYFDVSCGTLEASHAVAGDLLNEWGAVYYMLKPAMKVMSPRECACSGLLHLKLDCVPSG